jgi:N-methylhydantoinase A
VRTRASDQAATRRPVYFGPQHGERVTPVLPRNALYEKLHGGPLIIEEYEGTTVVPPNCGARLDDAGNIVIALDRAA